MVIDVVVEVAEGWVDDVVLGVVVVAGGATVVVAGWSPGRHRGRPWSSCS